MLQDPLLDDDERPAGGFANARQLWLSVVLMVALQTADGTLCVSEGRLRENLELILADARTATEAGAAPGGVRA